MTLSLQAKVRFLRRKKEVSTLWTEELDGVTILPRHIDRWHALAVNKSEVITR